MYFVDKLSIFVRYCESKFFDFELIDESTTSTSTTTKHESTKIRNKSITTSKRLNKWQIIYNEKWYEWTFVKIKKTNKKYIDRKIHNDQEKFCINQNRH